MRRRKGARTACALAWFHKEWIGRNALEAFVDRYLVVAHDPARLPLAPAARFTENGQRLHLGDGLCNTASARGPYKLYVADPEKGQVGFFGTIRENGTPTILALRLKLEGSRILEIETLVARDAKEASAVIRESSYGMNSGWSGWEQGLSSEPRS